MMLRWPERSFLGFLALIVSVAAVFGHILEGAAIAAFLLYVSSIDSKPGIQGAIRCTGKPGQRPRCGPLLHLATRGAAVAARPAAHAVAEKLLDQATLKVDRESRQRERDAEERRPGARA